MNFTVLYTFHEKLSKHIWTFKLPLALGLRSIFLFRVMWTIELLFHLILVWDTTPENAD